MKVELIIDSAQTPKINLVAHHNDERTQELYHEICDVVDRQTLRIDTKNGYKLLSVYQIQRVYTEQKAVYCEVDGQRYHLKERIYQMRALLSNHRFLQISSSEIVNRTFIRQFDLSKTGQYQVILGDGRITYASRRYMQKIKREYNQ